MELKEKLVALRKEKGLTQSAVAEKLDVSRQAISRWESGVALPSTDNLKCLSSLYEVPVDYLLKEDSEMKNNPDNEPTPDKIVSVGSSRPRFVGSNEPLFVGKPEANR